MRVAVIGAGAAGLSVLRLIPKEIDPSEVVCFESSNYYGGQWCQYEPKKNTVDDPSSSMYKNLVTNLPTIVMQYPDSQWTNTQSFVHHTDVAKYLLDYCYKNNLDKYVLLNRKVTNLSRNEESNTWALTSMDEAEKEYQHEFDSVFVCAGHFAIPRYFDIPGIEDYKGSVFHSRWFDDPAIHRGQNVLVVGKGLSGIDICCELVPYANKVIVASNNTTEYFKNYSNVHEVKFISKYDSGSASFVCNDGRVIDDRVDVVILCTGFSYDHPFMNLESCDVQIEDGFISPLYKFTVHAKHTSLFFIGLNQRICPFTLFYHQSAFCWAILTGKLKLPNNLEEVVQNEISQRLEVIPKRHYFCLGFQEEYELVSFFAEASNLEGPPAWLMQVRQSVAKARVIDPVVYKKHQICLMDNNSVIHSNEKGQLVQQI